MALKGKLSVFLCLVLVLASGTVSASITFGTSLPGLKPSGAPTYSNSAQLNLFSIGSDFLLTLTNSGSPIIFNNPYNKLGIGLYESTEPTNPGNFILTAQFKADGTYIANTGSLHYSGQFDFPIGFSVSGNLLSADLSKFSFGGDLIGFATHQLAGFATLFSGSQREVVYISATGLSNLLGFSSGALVATSTPITVNVVTTIPIPAATWLFFTGLGMLGLTRKQAFS